VLAVVSAAQFLTILDLWVVNIALPALQHDFAPAALSDVSWILDVYAIVLAALLLPAGRAADRIGRRECFLAGLVVFGLASAGCAVAPELPALIACRALQAAGAAVLMPTSLGLALSVFPAYQRGTAVGVWAGVGGVAAGSGPVLGGLLVESSWRWIFLINMPVILVTLAAGVAILPRRGSVRGEGGGQRIDWAGTFLVLGAVGLVCTALTEAPRWAPSRTWLVLAAGLVLAAAFVAHIRRHPDPLVAPRLFSARAFSAGAVGVVTYYTGFAAMLLATTLLLTVHWHFSVLQAAISIAPGPITAGIVSPFSGRLSARFGTRATVVAGALLFAAAAAWPLASAGYSPAYPAVILPSMLLWGVANALIQPSLFAAATAAPRAELASGSAVLAMARQLGSALGVAIFVAVLGARPASGLAGFDRAWIVVLITAAMTAFAGLATGRRLIGVPELAASAETADDAWQARLHRQPTATSAARRSLLHWIPAWLRSDRLPGHRPPAAGGKRVVLGDGSAVLIRQVQSADAPLLADGFTRLSTQSRRMRFLTSKKELSPAELRYFTDIDHHDHEALGALDQTDGRGVGIARYVRDAEDPQAAEIAVTIVDDWQGRGLGAELLAQLAGRARQEGVRRFTAVVAVGNAAMAALLRNMSAELVRYGPGTVEYEITLAPGEEHSPGWLAPLSR
jgi:EmrB/QacA subfamily drug resistance transporter